MGQCDSSLCPQRALSAASNGQILSVQIFQKLQSLRLSKENWPYGSAKRHWRGPCFANSPQTTSTWSFFWQICAHLGKSLFKTFESKDHLSRQSLKDTCKIKCFILAQKIHYLLDQTLDHSKIKCFGLIRPVVWFGVGASQLEILNLRLSSFCWLGSHYNLDQVLTSCKNHNDSPISRRLEIPSAIEQPCWRKSLCFANRNKLLTEKVCRLAPKGA